MEIQNPATTDVEIASHDLGIVSIDDEFELTLDSPRSPAHEDDIEFQINTPRDTEAPEGNEVDLQDVPSIVNAWGEGCSEVLKSGVDIHKEDDNEVHAEMQNTDKELEDDNAQMHGIGDDNIEHDCEVEDEFSHCLGPSGNQKTSNLWDQDVPSQHSDNIEIELNIEDRTTCLTDDNSRITVPVANTSTLEKGLVNSEVSNTDPNKEQFLKQSKEFSDVLATTKDKNDGVDDEFSSIPVVGFAIVDDIKHDNNGEVSSLSATAMKQTNSAVDTDQTEQDNEDDDETVSLDRILMKEKQDTDSDDDEFDFELPVTKPSEPASQPAESALRQTESVKQSTQATPPSTVTMATEVKTSVSQQSTFGQAVSQSSKKGDQQVASEVNATSVPSAAHTVAIHPPESHKQVVLPADRRTSSKLEAAQNEWDNVRTIQAGVEPTVVETIPPVSPHELTQVFQCEDVSNVKSSIRPTMERRGFSAFVNLLFGPPKLNRSLLDHRDRVFCMAATPFSNEKIWHVRTLQTIYRSLTGSKFDCPRIGSHWEEIGFQGTDPATDLRGVGILGLMNLLFFLKDPQRHVLANDIYRLSLHPTQNFPFCLMSINLSRIALQIMREELLNRECNRRGEVLCVYSDFTVALYLHMYQVWKSQGKTISDAGFIIKDIEAKARKNPRSILKNLEDYFDKKTKVSVNIRTDKQKDSGVDTFTNVCDDK